MKKKKALIDISKKTFIQVTALLLGLLVIAVALTYIIPAGSFGTRADGSVDYSVYNAAQGAKGIPLWKGALAPVLVFFSGDGLTLIMLSLFLLVISSAFQVMNDTGGIGAFVDAVSGRFKNRSKLMTALISLLFMCFGAFLGLFEEMLTMLPVVCLLCVVIGYDSFTGFLLSVVSCGYKHGIPPEADLVFDVRFMPNPFYIPDLRDKTGMDSQVRDYVFSFDQTREFLDKLDELFRFLLPRYSEEGKTMLVVAVGCTGGRHRSVAIARALAERIGKMGYHTSENHRDMTRRDMTHG